MIRNTEGWITNTHKYDFMWWHKVIYMLTGVLLVVAFDFPFPTAAMACKDL